MSSRYYRIEGFAARLGGTGGLPAMRKGHFGPWKPLAYGAKIGVRPSTTKLLSVVLILTKSYEKKGGEYISAEFTRYPLR